MDEARRTETQEGSSKRKQPYVRPETRKHEALQTVRGSGQSNKYGGGLYTECTLYYWY